MTRPPEIAAQERIIAQKPDGSWEEAKPLPYPLTWWERILKLFRR